MDPWCDHPRSLRQVMRESFGTLIGRPRVCRACDDEQAKAYLSHVLTAPRPRIELSRPDIRWGRAGAPDDVDAYFAVQLEEPIAVVAAAPDRLDELLKLIASMLVEVEGVSFLWRLRAPRAWFDIKPIDDSVKRNWRVLAEPHDDDRRIEVAYQTFGSDMNVISLPIRPRVA